MYLSEVKLEDVANVMWRTLGQFDQLLAILKGLTELLHTSLHPVHPVDALQAGSRRFKMPLCVPEAKIQTCSINKFSPSS